MSPRESKIQDVTPLGDRSAHKGPAEAEMNRAGQVQAGSKPGNWSETQTLESQL